MSESFIDTRCPECGSRIPPEAPWGLCPLCLMKQAAEDEDEPPREPAPSLAEVSVAFPLLEILEQIGRGGMGVVYKARQKSLNRLVALKLLAPGRQADTGFTARFQREAQALAELSHPNIVTVYDFGQSGGFYFLLMEFVDGVNLRQAMSAGRFSPEQALAVVPPICEALQFAHNRGIIHRDIKPENLLIDRTGKIKIVDFGIARMLRMEATENQQAVDRDIRVRLTGHELLGTPGYMAPEQFRSPVVIDQRTDIYALGVVLYELLTGELPGRILQPPSRSVQIDVRLDEIVLRALDAKPELRFSSATEFQTRVEALANAHSAPNDRAAAEVPPVTTKSPPPRLLKSGHTTMITQEALQTFYGQFFLYRNQGTLRLDEQRLIYTRDNIDTVIELVDIEELGVGRYPRSVNLAGTDFIAITHDKSGCQRRICLSPNNGLFGFLPSQFNRGVQDWYEAIYDAVTRTGREPRRLDPEELVVHSHPWTIAVLSLSMLWIALWFCAALVWFQWRAEGPVGPIPPATVEVDTASPLAADPMSIGSVTTPPTEIAFRVKNVEVPPNSHSIVLRFERDAQYGLAIEVSSDLTAGPGGELPGLRNHSPQEKTRVGLNQGDALSWTLPQEFSREEVLKGAEEVDRNARQMPKLPEGAVPTFAVLTHRDGWKYHLIARIVREPGSAWPPAPAGAKFTVEKRVVVPGESLVRVTPRSAVKSQTRVASSNVLIFQTASDRATGFLLRWRVYAPRPVNPPQPRAVGERLILDFVDPDTKITFHRVERRFAVGIVASSPEVPPLPARSASLVLAEPRSSSELHLLHMASVVPAGVGEQFWIDEYLNIENLGPVAPEATPAFRLPELRSTGVQSFDAGESVAPSANPGRQQAAEHE